MTNLKDSEFGFKQVSPENWLKIDPVWGAFGAVAEQPDPFDPWIVEVLGFNLSLSVPVEVRKLFEVARGTIAYSLLYYPLITIGTEQLFRVYEAAATHKCGQLNAPASQTAQFAHRIKWLVERGAILPEDRIRWDAVRDLRNSTSHPKNQSIFDPNMALSMLEGTVALIGHLFS